MVGCMGVTIFPNLVAIHLLWLYIHCMHNRVLPFYSLGVSLYVPSASSASQSCQMAFMPNPGSGTRTLATRARNSSFQR